MGVELLIWLFGRGALTGIPTWGAYAWLILAMIIASVIAGLTATVVERTAYRPLRNAPRLVPLISAIGVSFFLQDLIRLVESLTTGQFYRVFPTFGNFDERIAMASFAAMGSKVEINIQVKSVIVIVATIVMAATRVRNGLRPHAVKQSQSTAAVP